MDTHAHPQLPHASPIIMLYQPSSLATTHACETLPPPVVGIITVAWLDGFQGSIHLRPDRTNMDVGSFWRVPRGRVATTTGKSCRRMVCCFCLPLTALYHRQLSHSCDIFWHFSAPLAPVLAFQTARDALPGRSGTVQLTPKMPGLTTFGHKTCTARWAGISLGLRQPLQHTAFAQTH